MPEANYLHKHQKFHLNGYDFLNHKVLKHVAVDTVSYALVLQRQPPITRLYFTEVEYLQNDNKRTTVISCSWPRIS